MKALIYKDLIAIWNYCRNYIFLCAAFLVSSVFVADYDFLQMYPLIFMGMLVNTLIAYDERDKWEKLALTMPLTRRQIVTGKYLLGMILQGVVFVLTAAAHWLQLTLTGGFHWESYLVDLSLLLILATAAPSMLLPFVFKNGSEKGRMAYLIAMGVILGLAVGGSVILKKFDLLFVQVSLPIPGIVAAVALLLYPASWLLSVHWYEKREF